MHFRVPYNQNFINQINNEKGKGIICSDEQAKNKIEMSVQAENRNGETVLIFNNDNKVVFPRGTYYIFFRDDAGNYELDPFCYVKHWYYNKDRLKVYLNLSSIEVFIN